MDSFGLNATNCFIMFTYQANENIEPRFTKANTRRRSRITVKEGGGNLVSCDFIASDNA